MARTRKRVIIGGLVVLVCGLVGGAPDAAKAVEKTGALAHAL